MTPSSKININIVGTGNVGYHLNLAFKSNTDIDVLTVDPHSLKGLSPDADVIILAVSDNAITSVSNQIFDKLNYEEIDRTPIIVHTSGTTPINILEKFKMFGVFYPLQTFTKGLNLNYKEIPILIEGSDETTSAVLKNIASSISKNVKYVDSEKRRILHLASVLSCNFVNHMWTLSENILKDHDLDFSLLKPLIKETAKKAFNISPSQTQTGPAMRKDFNTIDTHLNLLASYPDIHKIYSDLTKSIISSYEI